MTICETEQNKAEISTTQMQHPALKITHECNLKIYTDYRNTK